MKMLRDLILVEENPQAEKTEGGILIIQGTNPEHPTGTVISHGPKADMVQDGDTIKFNRNGAIQEEQDGKKLLIIQQSNVYAVV